MTLVVAIDTATEAIALGIARVGEAGSTLLAGGFELAPRQANSRVLPLLREKLEACGQRPEDVGMVVVGLGPGSFTGVRIGVAAAKGVAHGLGVPLVGVGTLDAIAWRQAGHDGIVGVVGDAMRSEVYPALFRVCDGRVERLGADRVSAPEDAAAEWAASADRPMLLTGNGLKKHGDVFREALGEHIVVAPEEMWWPSGEGLVGAYMALSAGLRAGGDPGAVLPVYTRLSDAEEAERERLGLTRVLPGSGVSGEERA